MTLSQNPTLVNLAERIIRLLKGGDAGDAAFDDSEILAQAKQLAQQHGSEASAVALATLAEDLQAADAASNDSTVSDACQLASWVPGIKLVLKESASTQTGRLFITALPCQAVPPPPIDPSFSLNPSSPSQ